MSTASVRKSSASLPQNGTSPHGEGGAVVVVDEDGNHDLIGMKCATLPGAHGIVPTVNVCSKGQHSVDLDGSTRETKFIHVLASANNAR